MKKLTISIFILLLLSTVSRAQDESEWDNDGGGDDQLTNASIGLSMSPFGLCYVEGSIISKRPPKSIFLDIYLGPSFVLSVGPSGYHIYQSVRDSLVPEVILATWDMKWGWNKRNETGGLFGGSGVGIITGYGKFNTPQNVTPLIPLRIGTYAKFNVNIPYSKFNLWGSHVVSVFMTGEGSGLFFSTKHLDAPRLVGELTWGISVTRMHE